LKDPLGFPDFSRDELGKTPQFSPGHKLKGSPAGEVFYVLRRLEENFGVEVLRWKEVEFFRPLSKSLSGTGLEQVPYPRADAFPRNRRDETPNKDCKTLYFRWKAWLADISSPSSSQVSLRIEVCSRLFLQFILAFAFEVGIETAPQDSYLPSFLSFGVFLGI